MAECSLPERNMQLFVQILQSGSFLFKTQLCTSLPGSTEMVWLWLFVTSPFFRDDRTTVNPFHVLRIRCHKYLLTELPLLSLWLVRLDVLSELSMDTTMQGENKIKFYNTTFSRLKAPPPRGTFI